MAGKALLKIREVMTKIGTHSYNLLTVDWSTGPYIAPSNKSEIWFQYLMLESLNVEFHKGVTHRRLNNCPYFLIIGCEKDFEDFEDWKIA